MDKDKLVENVNKLGMPMMIPDKPVNAEETLAAVVTSQDARLWEMYPALLASTWQKYQVKWSDIAGRLSKSEDIAALKGLLAMSQAIYHAYHVDFDGLSKSLKTYYDINKEIQTDLRNVLAHNHEIPVAGLSLSTERVRGSFEDYLSYKNLEQEKQHAKLKEMSVEYALSQIFSPKQKELFKKRLNREKMTKTEREYFYRVVKKKAQALANPELHRLALKLMDI
ncbi:MAG: hypothetical protein KC900_13850 [Candidatus Omnitrophica bacterium]|nr:hypothetical protein [Candidatus Omnitrophota bacterium]